MKFKILTFLLFVCISPVIPYVPNRIVGGEITSIEKYPYMASICLDGYMPYCGGSIVSINTVLTAAHCLATLDRNDNKLTVYIVVGDSLNNQGDAYPVESYKAHPDYKGHANDLGVIRIQDTFIFSPKIQPITLSDQIVPDDSTVIISGWGQQNQRLYKPEKRLAIEDLQVAFIQIINKQECQAAYKNKTVEVYSEICAGNLDENIDSCQGDSGGPLVFNGEQVGIVSWGYGCADSKYPGVYTSVAFFYDWIQDCIDS